MTSETHSCRQHCGALIFGCTSGSARWRVFIYRGFGGRITLLQKALYSAMTNLRHHEARQSNTNQAAILKEGSSLLEP